MTPPTSVNVLIGAVASFPAAPQVSIKVPSQSEGATFPLKSVAYSKRRMRIPNGHGLPDRGRRRSCFFMMAIGLLTCLMRQRNTFHHRAKCNLLNPKRMSRRRRYAMLYVDHLPGRQVLSDKGLVREIDQPLFRGGDGE